MSKRPYNDGGDSPPAKRSRGRFEPSPYSRRDDRDRDGRHDHRDSYSKEKHNRYDDRRGKLEGPHKVNKESHGEDEYVSEVLVRNVTAQSERQICHSTSAKILVLPAATSSHSLASSSPPRAQCRVCSDALSTQIQQQ